ncbi:16477_t:CDS:2 [Funneliformis geosporum]|uniref:16477_t:CDS:1 n=1 Tax=Funneliformis geosporum TaxID=1117311 RepID=A0A9W4X575_9GLOM|nr:16477_t:CDS:2 [Funneliformis geosporum]
MKGVYANKLVSEKKDAKFIGKNASGTLVNNVRNQLPQSMKLNVLETSALEKSALGNF